jgi:hypothetical protein
MLYSIEVHLTVKADFIKIEISLLGLEPLFS